MGPRWLGAAGRRCRVQKVTWTAQDESARSRVLRDVTGVTPIVKWGVIPIVERGIIPIMEWGIIPIV